MHPCGGTRERNLELQQSRRGDVFEDMLGTSPQCSGLCLIRKVAGTNAPVHCSEKAVLVRNAAAAIHRRSARKDGPFVAINCNAIPRLFWRASCSVTKRAPLPVLMFNARDSGNSQWRHLFLDEIGELPPSIQVSFSGSFRNNACKELAGDKRFRSYPACSRDQR